MEAFLQAQEPITVEVLRRPAGSDGGTTAPTKNLTSENGSLKSTTTSSSSSTKRNSLGLLQQEVSPTDLMQVRMGDVDDDDDDSIIDDDDDDDLNDLLVPDLDYEVSFYDSIRPGGGGVRGGGVKASSPPPPPRPPPPCPRLRRRRRLSSCPNIPDVFPTQRSV